MTDEYVELLEDRIEIGAPPASVWPVVSDVCRMAEWSPQVESTRLCDGHTRVGLGVRFENQNSHGSLRWSTHGEIVRFIPEEEVAFRIDENWVVWSFRLEQTRQGGTVLTQRRETPEGISEFSLRATERYMGGQHSFTTTMRAGMRQTLEAIRDAVEREWVRCDDR